MSYTTTFQGLNKIEPPLSNWDKFLQVTVVRCAKCQEWTDQRDGKLGHVVKNKTGGEVLHAHWCSNCINILRKLPTEKQQLEIEIGCLWVNRDKI